MKTKEIHESKKGSEREQNKDDILILKGSSYCLFILFDGVSSAKNAKQGIDFLKNYINLNHNKYLINSLLDLQSLIFDANKKLLESGIEGPYTTITIVSHMALCKKTIYLSIGDSRIYEVDNLYIHQLTEDDANIINRNEITKCLGIDLSREEIKSKEYLGGSNRFLLCSDGFYHEMEKDIKAFAKVLNMKYFKWVKLGLSKLIDNKNMDDSSYILVQL